MKAQPKTVTRYAKWQYAALIITIILLAISAMPNLYGEYAAVDIQSKSQDVQQLDTAQFSQDLQQQDILLRQVSTDKNQITLLLKSSDQQSAARAYLARQLGDDYQVSMKMVPAAPDWLTSLGAKPLKLGLDLRGGVQFLLDVDTDVAVKERFKQVREEVRRLARETKTYGVKAQVVASDKVHVTASKDLSAVRSQLRQLYPEMLIVGTDDGFTIGFDEQTRADFETQIMGQNLHTMRQRIDQLGITEATTQRQGKNRIRIELPGVQNPEEAKRIIGATATLDFYEPKDNGKPFKARDGRTFNLDARPILKGKHIKDARAGQDENGIPLVNLVLDEIGGKVMHRYSQKHLGEAMVTVYSEFTRDERDQVVKKSEIINMATIQVVLGSRFSITNMSSHKAASELALLLRSGTLSAPVTIAAQSTIGPTLGVENIKNGMAALGLGLGIILVFMALWYRRLGWVANTALLLNLICLFGLMSLLPGAVLTLPGIAGLVLTVGMAVDTNVLIFERIREESKKGRSPTMAIEHGYNNAFATIFDANITTFMTALILYGIGYGPVKGFAITLALGIVTSMFTGVFASRAMVNLMSNNNARLLKGVAK